MKIIYDIVVETADGVISETDINRILSVIVDEDIRGHGRENDLSRMLLSIGEHQYPDVLCRLGVKLRNRLGRSIPVAELHYPSTAVGIMLSPCRAYTARFELDFDGLDGDDVHMYIAPNGEQTSEDVSIDYITHRIPESLNNSQLNSLATVYSRLHVPPPSDAPLTPQVDESALEIRF